MDQRDLKEELRQQIEDDVHDRIRRRFRERRQERMNRPRVMLIGDFRWGFVWGLIIAFIGVALLLDHMGIIAFEPLVRFWPMILVLFGVMNLTADSGRFFGFLLILVGAVLQLNRLGLTHLRFADLWPIAIIAVGLLVMWGSLETRGYIRSRVKVLQGSGDQATAAGPAGPDTLNAIAVFGGCERRISSKNFPGGKATAVFGGVELDFRDADINTDTGEAVLEINCILGGVEIRVPDSWHVHSRTVPVLGGYEDTSRQPMDAPGAKPKTLVITGMVVLGGVEIRN